VRIFWGLMGGLLLQAAWADGGKISLRVGYLPILDHLILPVAHALDNAHYAQLDVQPKLFSAWEEVVGALRAGKIDAAFLLAPLAIDLFQNGEPIRVVLLAHRNGAAITVQPDLQIHSAYSLRDKIVAIPAEKSTHAALLHAYLSSAGLGLHDVTTKVIAPSNMLRALQEQRIDAFIVAEPFNAKAKQNRTGKILLMSHEILPHHIDCIVVVRQRVINSKREVLQIWIDSLIRAGKWIEQDKTAGSQTTAHLVASYFPHPESLLIHALQFAPEHIVYSDLVPIEEDLASLLRLTNEANILPLKSIRGLIEPTFTHVPAPPESQAPTAVPLEAPFSTILHKPDTKQEEQHLPLFGGE